MNQEQPNIIHVTVDSLRADVCGFLGSDAGLTPTLDRLAESGIVFTEAVSPGPQTFSSMPATFTGHLPKPWTYDADSDETYWEQRLQAISSHLSKYDTIPQRLKAQGYTTVAVTPNPWTSAASGFDAGFDHFLDFSTTEPAGTWQSYRDSLPLVKRGSQLMQLLRPSTDGQSFFATGHQFLDDLVALREQLDEPYFIWVFLLDTHIPYVTNREFRVENSALEMYLSVLWADRVMRRGTGSLFGPIAERLRRSYRDTVRSVDGFVERLWTEFQTDDPVLVLHADHGESLGERGNYGHHHRKLYEENIHIPYLVLNAGRAQRVDTPISATTIPDVITSLATDRDGFDPQRFASEFVVAKSESWENTAVKGRRWKYIESAGAVELYDLEADPGETTNLAPEFDAGVSLFEAFVRTQEQEVLTADELFSLGASLAEQNVI